jgi:hypothetical protein
MNVVRPIPNRNPLPPQSLEAEESVIGGVLVHQRRFEDVAFLAPREFYHPALRSIFEAMAALHHQAKPIDVVTVADQMRSMDTIDALRAFDGPEYLGDLMAKVVTVENIAYHASVVHEKATARQLVEACREISARGYGDYGNVEDLIEAAEHAIAVARNRSTPTDDGFPVQRIAMVPDPGPTQWLVRDIWLSEGCGIIGGEPKSFKSFCAAQAATCVASGLPMFGRHEVQQGTVLMFNAEDKPGDTRERIARMCRSLDVEFGALPLHLIDVPAIRLDDARQVAKLSRTVAKLKPVLLILDPLRNLHDGDENDAQLTSALLSPLRIIQREHHCAVMLVHHMAKLTETQRRPGQRLRGSSALHGWVDSALYLTHKDGSILVEPEHRSAPTIEPFSFTVENAHTDRGEALWLEAESLSDAAEQTAARDRTAVLENSIIAALQEASEPLTGRDIRKKVKGRAEVIVETIKRLVATRLLVEETVMRGHQPVPGYRLNK